MKRRLPIATFLGAGVGALLAVPLTIVIVYLSSQAQSIIGEQVHLEARERAERLRDAVEARLDEVESLARAIQSGLSALDDADRQAQLLRAVLEARNVPVLLRFRDMIGTRDATGTVAIAPGGDAESSLRPEGWSVDAVEGALVFGVAPDASGAVDALWITVFSPELSEVLSRVIDNELHRAFALVDDAAVIAHSDWAGSDAYNPKHVLLAAADDLDLRNIWARSDEFWPMREDAAHLERGNVQMRAFVFERMVRPNLSLTIGYHTEARVFGAAFTKNRLIAIIAGGVLVISVIAGVLMSRVLSRPIQRLAIAAHQVEALSVDTPPELKPSPMQELDDANSAFSSAFRALGAFARFVPRAVVRQVMDGSAAGASQTEIRSMTIMFTDLAGFTGIAKRNSPEKTADLLNRHFAMITTIIDREGGTVDKFLGDGVMAFWGAPQRQSDHAARALRAAVEIAETFHQRADTTLRLRVGVCSGEVLVGFTGSDVRMNYTVIGDTVNVAARLQELGKEVAPAARTAVLVSGQTMQAAAAQDDFEDLGTLELRGRDEPTRVYLRQS